MTGQRQSDGDSEHPAFPRRKHAKMPANLHACLSDRRGATAVQVALMLTITLGFAALAVEVTTLFLLQKRMQNAADAAIMSASVAGLSKSNRLAAARAVAAANGQVNGVNGVLVTLEQPPSVGGYADATDAQAVVITRPFQPQLMRIFSPATITLRAQAVAAISGRIPGCLLALATSGNGVTTLTNAQIVNASCQLMANSTSANALNIAGGLISGDVYLAGGAIGNLNAITGKLVTYGPPNPDPYNDLSLVTTATCPNSNPSSLSGTRIIYPGRYCQGIVISNNSNITFSPGVYFIDSKFIIGNNTILNANGSSGIGGVTIVLNSFSGSLSTSTFQVSNNVNWSINAPVSGPTAGVAIAAQRNLTGSFQFNNGVNISINGVIYMPSLDVSFQGNAKTTTTSCTQLISRTITIGSVVNFRGECPDTAIRRIGDLKFKLAE